MKDGLAGQGSCWVIEFVFSQMSRIMKNIQKSSKRTGNDFDTSTLYLLKQRIAQPFVKLNENYSIS